MRLLDLSRVGSLLVAAIDAGGDGARIDGISFSHRDAAALEREARDAAFADARAKAEQYAGLAGQALGEVRHVVEGGGDGPVALRKGVMMAARRGARSDRRRRGHRGGRRVGDLGARVPRSDA